MNPTNCPECGNSITEEVDTTFRPDIVERVMTCGECPSQWAVVYSNPIRQDVISLD